MNNPKDDILIQLYNEVLSDRNQLQSLIDEDELHIVEIEKFLSSMVAKEDYSFKVFSPRNIENIYSEQITENVILKQKYEKEIYHQKKKISRLDSYLDKIHILLN